MTATEYTTSTPGNSSSHSKASKGLRTQQIIVKKPLFNNSTICTSKRRDYASTLIKKIKITKKSVKAPDSKYLEKLKHIKPAVESSKKKTDTTKSSRGHNSSRQPVLLLNLKTTNEQVKRTKSKVVSARDEVAYVNKTNRKIKDVLRNKNTGIKKQKSKKSRNKRTMKFLTNISNKLNIEKKREEKNEDSMDECRTVIEYDCDNDYSWIYNSLGGY